jgi:acyl carrier protein
MRNHQQIRDIVVTTFKEVSQQLNPHTFSDVNDDTVLFGRSGVLDSLGLVNLIVAVEQRLEDELGITLVLADEKALAQKNSPFRTVATLVDYILQQMDDHAHV